MKTRDFRKRTCRSFGHSCGDCPFQKEPYDIVCGIEDDVPFEYSIEDMIKVREEELKILQECKKILVQEGKDE